MTPVVQAQLRGIMIRTLKRELSYALGIGTGLATVWYFSVMRPRRKRYPEFYRKLDEAKPA